MSSKELSTPSMSFDTQAMDIEIQKDDAFVRTGRAARTLVKTPDMNIALIVMRKGDHIEEHDAKGAVTIFVKRGRIALRLPEESIELQESELLVLQRGVPHDVEALEDSAFLLTIGVKG